MTPWAFEKMLDKIRTDYDNPDVLVTENGYSSRGGLVDNDRVKFINYHLNTMMNAIEKGSNVKAYTVWSLMDNFEWSSGYLYVYSKLKFSKYLLLINFFFYFTENDLVFMKWIIIVRQKKEFRESLPNILKV